MMKTIAMEKTEETLECGVEPSLIRKWQSRAEVEPPPSHPRTHYVSRPISSVRSRCLSCPSLFTILLPSILEATSPQVLAHSLGSLEGFCVAVQSLRKGCHGSHHTAQLPGLNLASESL